MDVAKLNWLSLTQRALYECCFWYKCGTFPAKRAHCPFVVLWVLLNLHKQMYIWECIETNKQKETWRGGVKISSTLVYFVWVSNWVNKNNIV